jgi:hypothetical protein
MLKPAEIDAAREQRRPHAALLCHLHRAAVDVTEVTQSLEEGLSQGAFSPAQRVLPPAVA